MTSPEIPRNPDDKNGFDNLGSDEIRAFIQGAMFAPIQKKIVESVPRERAEMIRELLKMRSQDITPEDIIGDSKDPTEK